MPKFRKSPGEHRKISSENRVPKNYLPVIVNTLTNSVAFYEEGGTVPCGRNGNKFSTRYGIAFLISAMDGRPKTPINVLPVRKFVGRKIHMKSMMFHVNKHDIIVNVAWHTQDLKRGREGFVRVNVFQIGNIYTAKYARKIKAKYETLLVYMHRIELDRKDFKIFEYDESCNKHVLCKTVHDTILKELLKKNLAHIVNIVFKAFDKSSAEYTTYLHYKKTNLPDKFTEAFFRTEG